MDQQRLQRARRTDFRAKSSTPMQYRLPRRAARRDRKVRSAASVTAGEVDRLLRQCDFEGHPHHKSEPGDFGLVPPAQPRRDKTLCNLPPYEIHAKAVAKDMLRHGIRRKMLSELRGEGGLPQYVWPQYIWYVRETDGAVFEARLGGSRPGLYHGYPLPPGDRRRDRILNAWKERET
jgi:hypothetical protein